MLTHNFRGSVVPLSLLLPFAELLHREIGMSSKSLGEDSAGEVPEFNPVFDPLVINKRGRSYLQNVPIDDENPALLIGWYDDRVAMFVDIINSASGRLPELPDFLDLDDEELTPLLFKDSIHMELSEQGDGSFSNIIAPCTLDQLLSMTRKLGDIQRDPFIQAVAHIAKVGPLAACGMCIDNKKCEVIPMQLFCPPPPVRQVFA